MAEIPIISDYRCIIENIIDYKYRYLVWLSGRMGLAKSTNIASALLICGLMKRLKIVCVRETQKSIQDSVHAQLCEIIKKHNMPYVVYKETIIAPNGTQFIFKGIRETTKDNIRSLSGANICWIEEAQSISQGSWESLDPTIREEGSFIVISGNPDEESDTIYQLFGETAPRRKDTYYCYKSYLDNPFKLPDAILENIELMKKNRPLDYERIYLGKLRQMADNPVVKSWTAENIGVGKQSDTIYWSLDFNVNPQCSVICHWDGEKDFYFSDEIVLENASIYRVAEEFIRIYNAKYKGKSLDINGDASGGNRSSNSEYTNYAIIEQMLVKAKIPFNFNVPKNNPSVNNRVSNFDWHVFGIDGKRHILVNPECKHLINACKLLSYDKNGKIVETPSVPGAMTIDTAKSHIFDAASYCVFANAPVMEEFYNPPKPRVLTLKEQFEKSLQITPNVVQV